METSSLVSATYRPDPGRDASQQMEHLVMWVSNRDENGMELLVQGRGGMTPGSVTALTDLLIEVQYADTVVF
ncbi:hypothetical protein BFG06_14330 [Aeromonas caviae]|nr:hypothetical protein C2U37_02500 [Aeromonas sp. ASNIH1]OEG07266.1 hypothetical protein BFG06_14330 [Aeromonas caviae]